MATKRVNVHKKPLVQTKEEAFSEARRYLESAKKTLEKAGYEEDYGFLDQVKYAKSAAGTAYLAALLAIDGYLLAKGYVRLPETYEEYLAEIEKMNVKSKASTLFNVIHEALYYCGFYKATNMSSIYRAGFESVEELIALIGYSN